MPTTDLDSHFPPCGPCAMCGGPDARHRLWDSIDEQARLRSPRATARDFRVPVAAVRAVMAAYGEARRQHRRLPGR